MHSAPYLIDELNAWLPVINTNENSRFVEEVVEVGTAENEDNSSGKAGSVCDIRAPSKPSEKGKEPLVTPPPRANDTPSVVKQKQVRKQMQVLEDLLSEEIPPECGTEEDYKTLRCRYATLRAFQRKLFRLRDEAGVRKQAAWGVIRTLETNHPEYVQEYEGTYHRALCMAVMADRHVSKGVRHRSKKCAVYSVSAGRFMM